MGRTCRISVFVALLLGLCSADQDLVNNIGRYLNIQYFVLDNFQNTWITFDGNLTFENTGTDIPAGNNTVWSIYFCHTRLFEPERIFPNGAELGTTGLKAFHVNGCLHKFEPTSTFVGIPQGSTLEFSFRASDWEISRSDVMPNWYVTAPGAQARTIDSTAGYSLSWVADFDTPNKWKRQSYDTYNPLSGSDRLNHWQHTDTGNTRSVIPTPVTESLDTSRTFNIYTADWLVVYGHVDVRPEAIFLADKLGTIAVDPSLTPVSRYIVLRLAENGPQGNESYTLNNNHDTEVVTISGTDRAGAFYGCQSLLSLAHPDGDVPHGDIMDNPRFGYRGMHVDVGRNFRSKDDMLKLLDVMAMYKLNKFHFHLTDDEGWRLEIPGLPELTDIGSVRCHDLTGDVCILPQLGSPPGFGGNDGTGYYSVEEYREILQYANDRHIQVIPEFDMPGHGHAAINSMLARYRKYIDTNQTAAEEFLLSEIGDPSQYLSVQYFTDNAINPCIASISTFVKHLVREVKALHADIQPLTVFNFGGDEVPSGAWLDSTACKNSQYNTTDELKQVFVTGVAQIVHDEGLDLAGWEDGFTRHEGDEVVPIELPSLLVDNVYGYFWNNVWEWGNGERAYVMANAGYKAILAHATHLYYDHPLEPDPEDRGYYWAARVTSAQKTFNYMPDSMYENIGLDRMGVPLNRTEICMLYGCTPLEPGKEENIIGIQGHLWSETVRTSDDFDYMVYARMLTMAERAWHKASWEDIMNATEREAPMRADWEMFANTMGHKELARLDDLGVHYGVQPPGARVDGSTKELIALAEFPGSPMWYSTSDGATWTRYTPGNILSDAEVCGKTELQIFTSSVDNQRQSRIVKVDISGLCGVDGTDSNETGSGNIIQITSLVIMCQAILVMLLVV